jgi:DNA replication and repair protein RecF
VPLDSIRVLDFRGYADLTAVFGPGPQIVWGPNAAGKTSLLEAIVVIAWGRSHRVTADGELIRWDRELARVEGSVGGETIEVAIVRTGVAGGGRKRIRVNGVGRRAASLSGVLPIVVFAPEEMTLIAGSPGPRRTALDQIASQRSPAYAAALATYGRALAQRNSLLRAIREETASRDELRYWDEPLLDAGGEIVVARLRLLDELATPLAQAHAEIAPEESAAAPLLVRYATNAPPLAGETPRDALARRLADTADKEVWNGATLVGPHRDDLVFEMGGRDLATFASRGQQRTAILAFKMAELDLLAAFLGRPPLLLLDDVFSELDPDRRAHLVRRIAGLPQAFVTTTTLEDLDRGLVDVAATWEVRAEPDGARLVGPHVSAAPSGRGARAAARGTMRGIAQR